jgi:hypothetical protein
VNDAIINRPGPIFIGQERFVENLVRAFLVVADYDNLIGPTDSALTANERSSSRRT